jgi:hypothetical protein
MEQQSQVYVFVNVNTILDVKERRAETCLRREFLDSEWRILNLLKVSEKDWK